MLHSKWHDINANAWKREVLVSTCDRIEVKDCLWQARQLECLNLRKACVFPCCTYVIPPCPSHAFPIAQALVSWRVYPGRSIKARASLLVDSRDAALICPWQNVRWSSALAQWCGPRWSDGGYLHILLHSTTSLINLLHYNYIHLINYILINAIIVSDYKEEDII